MFGSVQCLTVLILSLLCVLLFNLVKLTELPPAWERAAICLGQALGSDLASS